MVEHIFHILLIIAYVPNMANNLANNIICIKGLARRIKYFNSLPTDSI